MRVARWLILLAIGMGLPGCSSGFSEEGIQKVKKEIESEYDKDKNQIVIGVLLIKETPNKLTGYV